MMGVLVFCLLLRCPRRSGLVPVMLQAELKTLGFTRSHMTEKISESPVFTKPLADITVNESSTIVLQGTVVGTTPITISWFLNGKAAKFGRASFSNDMAQWVIEDCLPEDAGVYECVAENHLGRASTRATVKIRNFETLQQSKHLPKNMSVNCGEEFGEAHSIHKAKGCRLQSQGENTQSSTGLLCPEDVNRKMKNRNFPKEAPRLLDPQNHVEVKAGQQAEVYIGIVGTPPIDATWLKEKTPVVNSSRVSVDTTETGTKLVMRAVQVGDAGLYTLMVNDRNGNVHHQISLAVVDKPEPPVGRPYVSEICKSSLNLSWSGPCYDGGSAIKHYVIEVKQSGDLKWRMLTDSCCGNLYHVDNLRPSGEYRFRVYAVNAHGMSEASEESKSIKFTHQEEEEEEEETDFYVTIKTSQKLTDLYIQQECLGVGTFGKVYKLLQKSNGKIRAGKFYKARTLKDKKSARGEIEIMNCLHHPKLVKCLDAFESRTEMVMVMEYVSGGELFERIVDEDFELTEPTCVSYVCQILEGVHFMHQQSILHLDLKPENIVCVNKESTHIKIIDFGLARKLDSSRSVKVLFGTPEFVAPEVINYDPVGFPTDTWSIGVICYILLSGLSPFQGESDTDTLSNVTAVSWEFDEDAFAGISENAKDFITCLLQKDMRKRLTCEDCLNHPWLQSTEQGSAKMLSKERMKRFLARQKWQKAGKALLALKRLAFSINKQDDSESVLGAPKRHGAST
ncbi:myosin light chain kinase, smooth muscle isoform X1 [Narcine bancroftii]|uniref:myosin light chain kinase, smooth muscle isoform X1 n=2 Tax=Narcine bancroftii TaxID=1343680 RepID=UPI0038321D7B